MKITDTTCDICGNRFLPKVANGKYCGPECTREGGNRRARGRAERDRKVNKANKAPPILTIPQVVALARKAGMSYGEYVHIKLSEGARL